MAHTSIPVNSPIEIINIDPSEFSPLISKCQIKVCYVQDEANRNNSIITKDVATKMAPSLRGAAIVGYYNENTEDFEQHNKVIEIKDKITIKETTRPYGFIDLNAKVWFQKFLDDDSVEREYLVTEGYLWTGQYPECERVIEKGNNQSMELDDDLTKGAWTNFNNKNMDFFIINEAVISKLCILGENVEPCFEGANITGTQFSFKSENIKESWLTFMANIKEILSKGGEKKMFNTYAVEIGNTLFSQIYNYLCENYPNKDYRYETRLFLEGIYEDEGQKFFVAQERDNPNKYLKFNFTYSETEFTVQSPEECSKNFEPQFSAEELNAYAKEYVDKKKLEEEDKKSKTTEFNFEEKVEEGNLDETSEGKENKIQYSLEDIPEYQELLNKFNSITNDYNVLNDNYNNIIEELNNLKEFKKLVERKEKQEMIKNFYMLSDADKEDVIKNIDEYSLDDIEAKLSIICFRNKVNFSENKEDNAGAISYTLEEGVDTTPDWIKAVMETSKELL